MRARLQGFAVALFASVAAAGIAGAQSIYPCTQTNDNLLNPYRLVANWASPPRPWMPVNAVAVDPNNDLWVADRCETEDCVPVIQLSRRQDPEEFRRWSLCRTASGGHRCLGG
jgi:hypothetical protein